MNRPKNRSIANRFRPHWIALGLAGAILVLAGCPANNTGGTNDNQAPVNDNVKPGNPKSKIVNISTNFPLSEIAPPVAIEYVVADEQATVQGVEVSGFYRQVADGSPGSDQIGEGDMIVATGLPAVGNSLFFSFDPSLTGTGFFRVGIIVLVDGQEVDRQLSTGTIQVQGPPDPVFRLPVEDVSEVVKGESVRILFDARDPEGDVRWRLFYLSETERVTKESTSADQLGTEIATGSSNVGEAFLPTNRLDVGTYEIGVSAVDSGDSITGAVSEGRQDQIVTVFGKLINVVDPPPEPQAPTLVFSNPSASGEILLRPEFFNIQFQATVDPSATGATLELFWDDNASASDGVTTIVDGLPLTDTSFNYRVADRCAEGVDQVEFFVGGNVVNVTPPLTQYAAGTVTIICTVNLDVTAPDTPLPFEPGEVVNIEWSTDAPVDSGTVDVFAFALDADGARQGPEIPILTGEPLTRTTATFTNNEPGVFQISVRLNLDDGTVIEQVSGQPVQFSSLPGVLWLGSLADQAPRFTGAIFEGVNFEDNAGTSFASVGDVNGDGFEDFAIAARYGKSFFDTGGGVGPGEAYLVFGRSAAYTGTRNLNSVGTQGLPGVVFVGIRTPQGNDATDGLTAVTGVPDLDGDGRSELMFGFPNTDSRGHNVSIFQDGVRDPTTLCTLEKQQQFLRGGVVIVSSQNSAFQNAGEPVINLDMVGQDFDVTRPQPDLGQPLTDWFADRFMFDEGLGMCVGGCNGPIPGDTTFDTTPGITIGFNDALADDYITVMVNNGCAEAGWYPLECSIAPCVSRFIVEPTSPVLSSGVGMSGFYPTTWNNPTGQTVNLPHEPLGARIIGIGVGDRFGTSVTRSNATGSGSGDIIISAPARTARGILFGPNAGNPELGGEVDGLEDPPGVPQALNDAGVAYLFQLRDLWSLRAAGPIPPKPHQYMIGQPSHTLTDNGTTRVPNIDALRIAGDNGDRIRNIVGIDDFNVDGLDDFAIGAPTANAGQGRVYIAFRRLAGVEGDFVLSKLELDPNDPDRLAGVLIESASLDSLGASLATGVDFNGDGVKDLVIGSPTASAGVGEIIVVFGDPNLTSPLGGVSVQTLLTSRDAQGRPRAARITGNALDVNGQFGFNIANPGDIDGDGFDDLLVAAPNATPRFDLNPNDSVDLLDEPGIDANLDGIKDDVSGQFGVPDNAIDSNDDLTGAGLVYVISGTNRFDLFVPDPNDASVSISIDQLGSAALRGFIIAGRRTADRLGGGDAGDVSLGGIPEKTGRGRSFGLAAAGDVNGDGMDDFLVGAVLADPRIDPNTGQGTRNGGEAYLVYGTPIP